MKKPRILQVQKDCSIQWYEQIRKTVVMPCGSKKETFYSIKPSDYVAILTQASGGEIIIVKQFRPVVEEHTYELPSGHLEEGETPEQAAIRELREETRCTAKNLVLLGENFTDTGRLENRQWAFYSNDIAVAEFPVPAENDGIEVCLVSPDELTEMINEGKFKHALDLCVIALAISKRYLKI